MAESTRSSESLASIVVGIDGTLHGERALGWAIRLARSSGATIYAVHAVGLLVTDEWGRRAPGHSHLSEVEDRFRFEWCATLLNARVSYDLVCREGDVIDLLVEQIRSVAADLVVVGARSTKFEGIRELGSTTRYLLESANIPVLVVPPPLGDSDS
ncbi:MAG: universal stress protein [Acidimicrobiales bacterium]